MNFPSIDIQGSILSTELLGKIRSEQAAFQQGKDFQSDYTNIKLKDDISLSWQEAKGQWHIFKSKLNRLKEEDTGTAETRNFWISPLLSNLGYQLNYTRQSEELNGKPFHIGYRDNALDDFPVYVGGYHESLDKRPENKQLRISPHAMVQEYLNYSEHLYGLVTNGRQLRLLRDASRITRLSYLEFNLEKIMEEDLYADFVILYRLLHSSRMPRKKDRGAESIIENYHQEGLEAGSAIRSKLGDAVKGAIRDLANGFINHPGNTSLKEAMLANALDIDEYYRHQLRIIYRLLFLFVIEERNLVYADSKTPETKRFHQIYYNCYSLLRLRKLARKLPPPDASRHYDLWQGLISTFALFEKKETGEKLGIMALQGDLFGYDAISTTQYDLHNCYVSNAVLLRIIKSLGYFENENGVLIAVNYGGLDVEEFGSVYEGLLELKLKAAPVPGTDNYQFDFDTSNERGKSGSHYTPEELVQPLIKHSLEYLIADRIKPFQQKKATKEATVQALLNLKIADVACGSGHILLSAARRLALEVARVQTGEEQPNPLAIRKYLKEVIKKCIYGVDKNPLAVELCKIALWLEAYNPGEPLSFLDHHIRCGDAIVGLAHHNELENGIANEAFKTLPEDDKEIAQKIRNINTKERKEREAKATQLKVDFDQGTEVALQAVMAEYTKFNQSAENTPAEVAQKAKAHQQYLTSESVNALKSKADLIVAQFFIPKTKEHIDAIMTDRDYRLMLNGYKSKREKIKRAMAEASERKFFHWFIEFPDVFEQGGFDCILGNPPFLGGKKISTAYGVEYNNWIKSYWAEKGSADLVGFFFRRVFEIIKDKGFLSLITTNTICQGDTREVALDVILAEKGKLIFAIKSMRWPGAAAVEVALAAITKGDWTGPLELNNKKVTYISSHFEDVVEIGVPYKLKRNSNKSFKGVYVFGPGFILSKEEAENLKSRNEQNKEIIFKYLIGEDLNGDPKQQAQREIINFFDWPEKEAKKYKECFKIVTEKVKPQRDEFLLTSNQIHEYDYWKFWDKRPFLTNAIKGFRQVLVACTVSKHLSLSFVDANQVFDIALNVIAYSEYSRFAVFQSNIHSVWAWKYGSTMKTDLRYTPSSCIETFALPFDHNSKQEQDLEKIGKEYHKYRSVVMVQLQLGLTKVYNLFHKDAITGQGVRDNDKLLLVLKKHLDKTKKTVPFNEAIESILQLRALHIQMDLAVLAAYGWSDIELRHDFYDMDYLPGNDRTRFTIHPDARKEILKRLMELNHTIYAAEQREKQDSTAPKKPKRGL